MTILSFAAFAVLKGVHAEKEVAETLGLLALPALLNGGVGVPGAVGPTVSVGVGVGNGLYGTGVNVGANVLGIGANVGVGAPSVGVNAVPSVGVNAAPSVGVNAAPSVETSAGTVLTTTPTRRGPRTQPRPRRQMATDLPRRRLTVPRPLRAPIQSLPRVRPLQRKQLRVPMPMPMRRPAPLAPEPVARVQRPRRRTASFDLSSERPESTSQWRVKACAL